MSNSITQKMKYKQSIIKFSEKYGVYKAAIRFNEWPKTIYRWKKRYDGTLESLRDESRRPKSHPPKENGRVERSHRKDQERFYHGKVFCSLEDLRNRGKYWRQEYNNFPMKPLGWLSPLEFYKKWKSQEEAV